MAAPELCECSEEARRACLGRLANLGKFLMLLKVALLNVCC